MQSTKIALILLCVLFSSFQLLAQKVNNKTKASTPNYKVKLTSEAFFPAGEAKLYEILNRKIIFTDTVRDLIDQGVRIDSTVLLSFYVEPDSSISDMSILQDVGHGIGQRLADFVQTLKYAPGKENEIPMRANVILSMPIILK